MDLLEVFDENNKSLNYAIDRDEVHKERLWHRHASAWIMNEDGSILMQKRSLMKKKNPGLWSKTGGHVDYGEDPESAFKREVFEEIGLKIDNFELIDIIKFDTEKEKYYAYGYIVFTNKKEKDFILQTEEVDSVKYYKIEELIDNKNNSNFTFYKWDNDSFNTQMNILKYYRNKILNRYNIEVKDVYNKLVNDNEIVKIYSLIEQEELKEGRYAFHNMQHILNVTNIATQLLNSLKYDEETILQAKIACFLHDVGALQGKDEHALRSYEYAKKLFQKNNWYFAGQDEVLDAIKNHSDGFDNDNILRLTIILADKLDIKGSRITEEGSKIPGNRQYCHINDIIIDVSISNLIINFVTDPEFDYDEFMNYYFNKKVFKAIESFAITLNLKYEITINNKKIIDKIN